MDRGGDLNAASRQPEIRFPFLSERARVQRRRDNLPSLSLVAEEEEDGLFVRPLWLNYCAFYAFRPHATTLGKCGRLPLLSPAPHRTT